MNEEEQQPVTPAAVAPTPVGGLSLTGEKDERLVPAGGNTLWKITLKSHEGGKKKVRLRATMKVISVEEGAADWECRIYDSTGVIWDSNSASAPDVTFNLDAIKPKEIRFELMAPKGVRFAEACVATLEACFDGTSTICASMEFKAVARQSMMILKASIGHEKNVADDVASRSKTGKSGIYTILAPTNLHGYILIEGMNTDQMRESVRGIRRARGLVEGETSFAEIDHFLTPKPLVSGISEGDVVELIAGPFKGEKARVKQIDEAKEEITVELFEAMVPIPVTVRGDHVRVLEKEK
jgi:transcriptional antiterminator NusG